MDIGGPIPYPLTTFYFFHTIVIASKSQQFTKSNGRTGCLRRRLSTAKQSSLMGNGD